MDLPLVISKRPKPALHSVHVTIGCLIFPRMDQIDFTGPFEVLSRVPDSTVHVVAKTVDRIRDVQGLILTPGISIAETPELDVLLVPGGYGQRDLMEDEEVLSLIRRQAESGRIVLSVCTGALLCGAAGILRGRRATTHWAAWDLLPYYGAVPTRSSCGGRWQPGECCRGYGGAGRCSGCRFAAARPCGGGGDPVEH